MAAAVTQILKFIGTTDVIVYFFSAKNSEFVTNGVYWILFHVHNDNNKANSWIYLWGDDGAQVPNEYAHRPNVYCPTDGSR